MSIVAFLDTNNRAYQVLVSDDQSEHSSFVLSDGSVQFQYSDGRVETFSGGSTVQSLFIPAIKLMLAEDYTLRYADSSDRVLVERKGNSHGSVSTYIFDATVGATLASPEDQFSTITNYAAATLEFVEPGAGFGDPTLVHYRPHAAFPVIGGTALRQFTAAQKAPQATPNGGDDEIVQRSSASIETSGGHITKFINTTASTPDLGLTSNTKQIYEFYYPRDAVERSAHAADLGKMFRSEIIQADGTRVVDNYYLDGTVQLHQKFVIHNRREMLIDSYSRTPGGDVLEKHYNPVTGVGTQSGVVNGVTLAPITINLPIDDFAGAPLIRLATIGNSFALDAAGRLVSHDGSSLISNDGGSLVSHDGSSLVSHDGGSIAPELTIAANALALHYANSGLVSHDGSSLVSHDGSSLVSHDGSSLVSHDGSSLVSHDGSSLVSHDGGSLVSHDGSSLKVLALGETEHVLGEQGLIIAHAAVAHGGPAALHSLLNNSASLDAFKVRDARLITEGNGLADNASVGRAPDLQAGEISIPGLIALYRFDSSDNLGDEAGGASRDLAATGGASYTATGKFGGALHLDGTGFLSTVDGNIPGALPAANNPYTISGWVKPLAGSEGSIVGWGASANIGGSNALRASANGASNAWGGGNLSASQNLGDGDYHLVTATYDGTIRKIYVDGALKASDTPAAPNVVLANGPGTPGALVTLNFDNLSPGDNLRNQYAPSGVIFTPSVVNGTAIVNLGDAVSPPNTIFFTGAWNGSVYSQGNLIAEFRDPISGAALTTDYVEFTPTDAGTVTRFTMRAYDINGNLIGEAGEDVEDTGRYLASEDPAVSISVTGIHRVELIVGPSSNPGIEGDNFRFHAPARRGDGFSIGSLFNGDIDDLAIYNRALTAGEISQLRLGRYVEPANGGAVLPQQDHFVYLTTILNTAATGSVPPETPFGLISGSTIVVASYAGGALVLEKATLDGEIVAQTGSMNPSGSAIRPKAFVTSADGRFFIIGENADGKVVYNLFDNDLHAIGQDRLALDAAHTPSSFSDAFALTDGGLGITVRDNSGTCHELANVRGRFIDSDGNPTTAHDFIVSDGIDRPQTGASGIALGNGKVAIVYDDRAMLRSCWLAGLLNADGTLALSPRTCWTVTPEADSPLEYHVARLFGPARRWLRGDPDIDGDQHQVYRLQRFTPDLDKIGTYIQIAGTFDYREAPIVRATLDGGFVVAGVTSREDNDGDPSDVAITLSKYDPSGALVASDTLAHTFNEVPVISDLTFAADGQILLNISGLHQGGADLRDLVADPSVPTRQLCPLR